ncbi:MAG: PAS domain S-box protein [Clostridia bacterium]|nr:PAS domain S-box protein [Clostridia bacterium]
MITNTQALIALIITTIINFVLTIYLAKGKNKNQLSQMFTCALGLLILWSIGLIMQMTLSGPLNIDAIYFDYFVYIPICFVPITVFFIGLIFANTKIKFKKKHLLLFIVPIISLLVLWTNDFHHLFYKQYSTSIAETIYGPYMTIHNIYSYILLGIGIIYLLRFSIKNSGFFSKQSLLILLGISVPVIVNILGTFKIIPMSIYITPITFTATVVLSAISIFKFQFLGVAPIALQKIVDRISDSYVVLSEDNKVTDFNKTFLDTFKLKSEDVRSKSILEVLGDNKNYKANIDKLLKSIEKTKNSKKTISYEQKFEKINKYFTIEIASISSENASLGTLVMFKDITQHKEDMETIKSNQDVLMEQERLASLGQLIGGIAHNLKTPIMSIAGAAEGLDQLIKEYDESIDDPLVNSQDHHEIAKEMLSWIPKIRMHTEYMSDVITTVKGQAVALSNDEDVYFTVGELVKKVNILMKHELKNAYTYLNVMMKTDENLTLKGDVNSLVQVVNNMISNSIQAYNGARDKNIDLEVNKKGSEVIFSVRDYAGGLPKEVQDKLFKEMITTKGKNGTGLGLYMSYSNIKARFGGDITFDVSSGKGTTFNIIIPIKK